MDVTSTRRAGARFCSCYLRALPLLALLSAALPGWAQNRSVDDIITQLEQVRQFSGVSISPNGQWVSWTETIPNSSSSSEIYLLHRSDPAAKPRRLTAGDGKSPAYEYGLVWAPDSTRVGFLSNAHSAGQQQVFVAAAADGNAQQLTHITGHVADIRWSKDGKQIAFLYAENGGGGGPLQAASSQTGAIGSDIHNHRIAVIGTGGGGLKQISPAALNVYEYDWSHDGSRFAAIAAPGPADNNWWIAQLYTVDIASGSMQVLYKPPADLQLAVPRWSPDGKRVGFIGGLMSDEGFNGGDLFVVASAGGSPRKLPPEGKSSVNGFAWRADDKLVFTAAMNGGGSIATADLATGQVETLWKGPENVHQDGNYPNFSIADDGRTSALIRSSWKDAPEMWAGPIGEWRQLSHTNPGQEPYWGKAESLTWENEGFHAQGWLLYPKEFDPTKRYPMVVEIHGGPAGMKSPSWPSAHFDMSVMAGLGYFVFFPNPRGSYGQGEAFTKANVKDFGGGDLRDVFSGVDAVLKRVPVDSQRIGVTGWSYGGFMTMWAVTQTNRFRAAVAGAGISDWLSYYGENLIDRWMIPYFGSSVYDNPDIYAKSSPITFIKKVQTPTLIVVGERDAECPAPQSFEFWHALKTIGVPTQLVVYPGEGHSFRDPKNRSDVLRRAVAWFSEHLQSPGASRDSAHGSLIPFQG